VDRQRPGILLFRACVDEKPLFHWGWLAESVKKPPTGHNRRLCQFKKRLQASHSAYVRAYNTIGVVREPTRQKHRLRCVYHRLCQRFGVKEARSLVTIPVVGLTESNPSVCQPSRQQVFRNLLPILSYQERIQNLIKSYGAWDKLASIRLSRRFELAEELQA